DDLRPTGAVCEQSVYEDDILRLQRCLGAGNSIKHGKSGHSGGGPDQCPSIHHSLQLNYCLFCGAPKRAKRPNANRRSHLWPKLCRSSRACHSTVGNLRQQTERLSEGLPVTTKKYFSRLNIN